MKKTLAIILALAMICSLLAFAGCGDDKTTADDKTTPDTGKTEDNKNQGTQDQGGTTDTPPATGNDQQGGTDTPPATGDNQQGGTSTDTPAPDQGGTTETPHSHTWDSGVVSKEATCGSEGAMLYSCACGEKKLESIAKKTEHTWDNGVIEGATKTITCTVCKETKTEKIEGVHEHEWTPKTTKLPTCGTEGEVELSCACGEKFTSSVKATGNHSYTSQGICSVCGDVKTSASPSDIG